MSRDQSSRRSRAFRRTILTAAVAAIMAAGSVAAQTPPPRKNPNPFQGFSSDNGKPVDITSEALEVHQEQQMAVFTGKVVAVQGDSTLCAPKLVVYYDNEGQPADAPTQSGAIKKLEAEGGVVVTARDQVATGKRGVFDMASNVAVLNDDVVLTQGPNVIKGNKLTVDLKTGVARVEGSRGVTSSFQKAAQAGAATALTCTSLAKEKTQ